MLNHPTPTTSGQRLEDLESQVLEIESLLWLPLSTEKWWAALDKLVAIRAQITAIESTTPPVSP